MCVCVGARARACMHVPVCVCVCVCVWQAAALQREFQEAELVGSVLQRVAACCSVLQRVAVCCIGSTATQIPRRGAGAGENSAS